MSSLQDENEALKTKIADLEAIIAALREEIRTLSRTNGAETTILAQAHRIAELEQFIARSQKNR